MAIVSMALARGAVGQVNIFDDVADEQAAKAQQEKAEQQQANPPAPEPPMPAEPQRVDPPSPPPRQQPAKPGGNPPADPRPVGPSKRPDPRKPYLFTKPSEESLLSPLGSRYRFFLMDTNRWRVAPVPEPSAEQQAAALAVVKGRYDLTADGDTTLLAKLLDEAIQPQIDPVERYVILDQALQLALMRSNVTAALNATRQLYVHYQIDIDAMELASFRTLLGKTLSKVDRVLTTEWAIYSAGRSIETPGGWSSAEEFCTLAADLLKADDAGPEFDHARSLLGLMSAWVAWIKAEVAAKQALEANPNDKAAKTALGRLYCFNYNPQWDEGLALLADGDDAALAKVAALDIAGANTPDGRIKIANAWWDVAAVATDSFKRGAEARAAHWYRLAEPNLTGERQKFVASRLAKLPPPPPTPRPAPRAQSKPAGPTAGPNPPAAAVAAAHDATSIVYVCDATGTMLGHRFDLLKQQLRRSIESLPADARFNVIFFRGGSTDDAWSMPMSKSLETADDANKRKALAFIDGVSVLGAGTNPLPALRAALASKPKRLIFLTDGQFNNYASYAEVKRAIKAQNPGKRTRIDTILLMSDDPDAESTLRDIATDAGGRFKRVLEKDLTP